MAYQPGASLDQSLAQRGQRPSPDLVGSRERAQEVREVVSQRMKLEPDNVCREAHARQPRPLQRVLALFDVLLGRAALVVERQHPLVRQATVGDDEADTREEFSRMELDLGHYPAGLRPALRPVTEAGVLANNVVRRSAGVALHQPADLFLQLGTTLDADGVVPALSLKQIV